MHEHKYNIWSSWGRESCKHFPGCRIDRAVFDPLPEKYTSHPLDLQSNLNYHIRFLFLLVTPGNINHGHTYAVNTHQHPCLSAMGIAMHTRVGRMHRRPIELRGKLSLLGLCHRVAMCMRASEWEQSE